MVPVVCVSISRLLKKANPVSCPRTFAGEAPVILQLLGLIQLGKLEGAQLALWVSQAAIREGWQRGQSTRKWKRKKSGAIAASRKWLQDSSISGTPAAASL